MSKNCPETDCLHYVDLKELLRNHRFHEKILEDLRSQSVPSLVCSPLKKNQIYAKFGHKYKTIILLVEAKFEFSVKIFDQL